MFHSFFTIEPQVILEGSHCAFSSDSRPCLRLLEWLDGFVGSSRGHDRTNEACYPLYVLLTNGAC
jgi:hypothetical protein